MSNLRLYNLVKKEFRNKEKLSYEVYLTKRERDLINLTEKIVIKQCIKKFGIHLLDMDKIGRRIRFIAKDIISFDKNNNTAFINYAKDYSKVEKTEGGQDVNK